ncbi:MAG: 4-hydroxy-3-methylbut-2-enyl diphosphate reductase [Caldanaerobacter subterraneus]|jgi:4-hydroxy-3-methylbut-2-enyl diphosphate reductase|uniref:4-hydroxy-3-methylbut-2-enyl diphosphate reductase n=2 Tax=Caldanaerobacter subterraneus TaxID=911092 RepID=ISPH_CALS4|nr:MULTISPECIES: 4-hydroxy-3-methylbut-2-enyl diphosphate reductase [Caldanaerobacter]Q8RA76.1 RecName: Full=4-hydroxy-3-methylbut-2-enyl diphosphate reductase; Short=HMBPP reductase [Caldanaerobacter subterraneus subsp. tengcongensis MB4]AAM24574.1 Penicillin tolerance protein [Caldanaerobacter subterraneus subsp. tengcongensis MB4]KUK09666.1 MAG: 4-hydroxy-3-methylbut-2-enyl diphosphate reductase [Caldanaerobacter subterraneus]MCS3915863.1 4-hydroxy-3-methylbut-2-enyl diphosphate reductase [C
MEILIAEHAGFCFGVKRAIEIAYEELNKQKDTRLYTLGEIIHNPQVVKDLEEKGVRVIEEEELEKLLKGDRLIIRSHGISKKLYEFLEQKGVEIIDVTCPFVKKVQNIVEEYYKKGYDIVIVGDKNHPEVIGVNGWCEDKAYIVNSVEEAENLPFFEKACAVSQTTLIEKHWEDILEVLKSKAKELVYFNTICNATQKRQEAADALSKKVDVMFVIGGKHSSNTQKLRKICEKNCKNTYHIERADEITFEMLKGHDIIGITAGASTPDYVIEEVIEKIKSLKGEDENE